MSRDCPTRQGPELADVFRLYGEAYRQSHPLPPSHLKVMRLIEICRTTELGGHLERCDRCGHERPAYNSCRNRHCPKCQTMAKERWIEARRQDLLPVSYFHDVFTLPHELNPLVLVNKTVCFNILFRSVAETLQAFAADPRWKLQGRLGFIAVLHTWTQQLFDHFHLHLLIPAGALSIGGSHWVPAQGKHLFHYDPVSRAFRHRFLSELKEAYQNGDLAFPGTVAHLQSRPAFYALVNALYEKHWVVYSKRPFAGPQQVLDYLGRYTHRVAISNDRILSVENERVTFSYRDRSDGNRVKTATLSAEEFIRRFLLHVVPSGFMRIRHFGFLANACKQRDLARIRELLGQTEPLPEGRSETVRELMARLTGIDISRCPQCEEGTMVVVGPLPKPPSLHTTYVRGP